jgi:uncharacterized membrane protein YdjX (TVP38/TMEM64 family)
MKWDLPVLAVLVAVGVALDLLGIVDWRVALEWARGHSGEWWLPAGIVLAQLALYTFAQPGSALFWVAALLYPPPAATLILTAGGTTGALGAHLFSHHLTRRAAAEVRGRRLFHLLERQGDFFTLCALRVLPGMPHSVLNYASGILGLPLPRFLAASAVGLALKSYFYTVAVDRAIGAVRPADLVRLDVLGPLFAIALFLLLGRRAYRAGLAPSSRSRRQP